jgi:integrase/recombinase XerD
VARAQRVSFPDEPDTYTVVGADGLPIGPAAEYLRFLRDNGASPHTVRAYAAGIAEWWTVLEHTGHPWDDFPTNLFGQFLRYLRTGDLPGTPRIGAPQQKLAASSLQPRAAAVLSMYRYHADAHNAETPYRRLFTSRGSWRRYRRYVGFLDGVGPQRNGDHPIYRIRTPNKSATPVLTPPQVNTILDACSVQHDGDWTGGPAGVRNRLLFAVLAETGWVRRCRCGTTTFTSVPERLRHRDRRPPGPSARRAGQDRFTAGLCRR